MSRLPPQPRDQLRPEDQQPLHDHFHMSVDKAFELDSTATGVPYTPMVKDGVVPSHAVGGPLPFFAVLPSIGKLSLDILAGLGEATQGLLPLDAREVASLVTMSRFGSSYGTHTHTGIATKYHLLSCEQCQAITRGEKPSDLSEAGSLAYDTTNYLMNVRGPLSQELWDKCLATFGKEGTVGLVHYVALYSWTSLALNAADVKPPESEA